jgi:hypothetical protein
MKTLHRNLMLAAGLAILVTFTTALAHAEVAPSATTDPGFVPNTGQINPGFDPKNSRGVGRAVPTPAESLAAILAPVATEPSAGADPQGQQGGPALATAGDQPTAATTGAAPTLPPVYAKNTSAPSGGPIGSFGQTIPAKFSERNDVLDRTPTMALPLVISMQDRQRIYQAVMDDKSAPAAGADALRPASVLSAQQAFTEIHALPDAVKDMPALRNLQYLKAKNKVFIVNPVSRVVVDQITS